MPKKALTPREEVLLMGISLSHKMASTIADALVNNANRIHVPLFHGGQKQEAVALKIELLKAADSLLNLTTEMVFTAQQVDPDWFTQKDLQ